MKVLVIGGIAAGASIAAKAKRTNPNAEITIIEMENYLSFGSCGLPYYIGNQFENSERMFARSVEKTKSQGINVLTRHQALDIDFDKKIVNVKNLDNNEVFNLDYDKLAIATGAKPIIFGEGSDSENVFTITRLNEVDNMKEQLKLAEKVVVVGTGFIGLEIADQLVNLGKKVQVIQRSENVMDRAFDVEFSELITKALEEIGVEFIVGETYKQFEVKNNKAYKVVTDKSSYECDLAVLALGFKPNTQFIKDERLEKLENGAIKIDEFGHTSIEDVYACGDCATVYSPLQKDLYLALATYANKMGRIIGENIVSIEEKPYIGSLMSSSLKVGEYGVGTTGLTEKLAKKQNLKISTSFIKTKNQTSYYPGQEDLYIKLIYDKNTKVLYGGQVFGKNGAVERLTAITVAVYSKLTVSELGFMDFAYSPPYSPTWDGLNVAGNASK